MPVWLWFVEGLAVLVGIAIALLVALVLRRRALERSRGSFSLSVKQIAAVSPRGWRPGIALYRTDEVQWFSLFSLAWSPKYRLRRGEVDISGRRDPVGQETVALPEGQTVIVMCSSTAGIAQMALSNSSLTGLLAWLEASPPGRGVSNVL